MSLNEVHRVEKWRLETEFHHSTLKEVNDTNDLLSQLSRYSLSFILDKVLNEVIGNQNIKIGSLHLDLGSFGIKDIEQDFPKRFETELRKRLKNYLIQHNLPSKSDLDKAHEVAVAQEMQLIKDAYSAIYKEKERFQPSFSELSLFENKQQKAIESEIQEISKTKEISFSNFEEEREYVKLKEKLFFQKSTTSFYSDFEAFVFYAKMGYYPLFWEIPPTYDLTEQYYKLTLLTEKEQVAFFDSVIKYHPDVIERLDGIDTPLTRRLQSLSSVENFEEVLADSKAKILEAKVADSQEITQLLEIHQFSERIQLFLLYVFLKNEIPWWAEAQKIHIETISTDEVTDFLNTQKDLFLNRPSIHFFEKLTDEQLRDSIAFFQKEQYPKLIVHINLIQELFEKEGIKIEKRELWMALIQVLEERHFAEKDIKFITLSYLSKIFEKQKIELNTLVQFLENQKEELDSTSELLLKWLPKEKDDETQKTPSDWFWQKSVDTLSTDKPTNAFFEQLIQYLETKIPFADTQILEQFLTEALFSKIIQLELYQVENQVNIQAVFEAIKEELFLYIESKQPFIPIESAEKEIGSERVDLEVFESKKIESETSDTEVQELEKSDLEKLKTESFEETDSDKISQEKIKILEEQKVKEKLSEILSPEKVDIQEFLEHTKQKIKSYEQLEMEENEAFMFKINYFRQRIIVALQYYLLHSEIAWWSPIQEKVDLIAKFRSYEGADYEFVRWVESLDKDQVNTVFQRIIQEGLEDYISDTFPSFLFQNSIENELFVQVEDYLKKKETSFWKLFFQLKSEKSIFQEIPIWKRIIYFISKKIQLTYSEVIQQMSLEKEQFEPFINLTFSEIQQLDEVNKILNSADLENVIIVEQEGEVDRAEHLEPFEIQQFFKEGKIGQRLFNLSMTQFSALLELETIKSPDGLRKLLSETPKSSFMDNRMAHLLTESAFQSLIRLFLGGTTSIVFSWFNYFSKLEIAENQVLKSHFLEFVRWVQPDRLTFSYYLKDFIRFLSITSFQPVPLVVKQFLEKNALENVDTNEQPLQQDKLQITESERVELGQKQVDLELSNENAKKLQLQLQAELTLLKTQLDKIKIPETTENKSVENQEEEESRVEKELEGKGISVRNAGVVLIWPFFSHYFNFLGMLNEERKFKSKEEAKRAVHLIQYLAVKQTNSKDPDLILNKILCGLPVTTKVPKSIEMTDKEIELAESMLQAVIKQWPAVKNSTNDGLRGSFFVRNGTLTKNGDNWDLKIESKAWDILLDKLNWGLSLIKLSWMKGILTVEWRKK